MTPRLKWANFVMTSESYRNDYSERRDSSDSSILSDKNHDNGCSWKW
jgi:hypothetical protein